MQPSAIRDNDTTERWQYGFTYIKINIDARKSTASRRERKYNVSMHALPPLAELTRAFLAGDPAYEGIFFVAVKTTGIFCRPTCKARKPLLKNVEFFATKSEALHAGYRPCLRCKPMNTVAEIPAFVEKLKAMVEENPAARLRERDLVEMGVDPSTARRQFQRVFGMSFHAYQRARRMGEALSAVRKGRKVLESQLDHGFESASGFRDAFAKVFGAPPSKAARVTCLYATWLDSPLGPMLAIADDRGLHIVDWVDRRGLERAIERLRAREKAAIVPGEHPFLTQIADELHHYFAGTLRVFNTPLAAWGTPFQNAVWQQLLAIPTGQTRTYAGLAEAMGAPAAVRAVARANGDNFRGIVIPCHRVIGSNGDLTGYGGGLPRKQWLLDHEQTMV
jgi:AraC family transcriptional regulator, regulatory protein of adaptative response / methylated-DNA-[protein]-cysteine methyltransferase